MEDAISGHQRPPEAIRGNQQTPFAGSLAAPLGSSLASSPAEAPSATDGRAKRRTCMQGGRHSEALRGTQRDSVAIKGEAAHRLNLIFEGLERDVVEDSSGGLPHGLGARAALVLHQVHLLHDGATLQVDGSACLAQDAVDDGRKGLEHLAQARVLAPAYAQVVARTPKRVDVGTLRLTVLAPVALGHGSGHELKRALEDARPPAPTGSGSSASPSSSSTSCSG